DGFPIDLPDQDFYTPLLHAVEKRQAGAVDILLSQGSDRIDINRRCVSHHRFIDANREYYLGNGATALVLACLNGDEEIVGHLLQCTGLDASLSSGVNDSFKRQGSGKRGW